MLRKVFENYVADPSRLGDAAAKRIDQKDCIARFVITSPEGPIDI
jgi:hypothetical protein